MPKSNIVEGAVSTLFFLKNFFFFFFFFFFQVHTITTIIIIVTIQNTKTAVHTPLADATNNFFFFKCERLIGHVCPDKYMFALGNGWLFPPAINQVGQ